MSVGPSAASVPAGAQAARRRSALGRAWIAVVLMALELGMLALAVAAYQWSADSSVGVGVAPFVVIAVSAAFGMVVLVVLLAANAAVARAVRAGRSPAGARGLVTLGQWLAVLRLLALVGSVVVVAVAPGGEAGDMADYGLLCFAGIDALFSVFLAVASGRGVRP